MRTTLDIDDDVLEAAKELAREEKTTAGKVLSDLARQALSTPTAANAAGVDLVLEDGFYRLSGREGVTVTRELVDRLADQAVLEDADLARGPDADVA